MTATPSAAPSPAVQAAAPSPAVQAAAAAPRPADARPAAVTDAASQPGSWSALAGPGFLAPRGAGVGSAALVTAPPARETEATRTAGEVVVLAGDSLWSIAARHLGPAADATEVAAAWPRWWEANRSVVGDDPHLLLPGQRLVAPAP